MIDPWMDAAHRGAEPAALSEDGVTTLDDDALPEQAAGEIGAKAARGEESTPQEQNGDGYCDDASTSADDAEPIQRGHEPHAPNKQALDVIRDLELAIRNSLWNPILRNKMRKLYDSTPKKRADRRYQDNWLRKLNDPTHKDLTSVSTVDSVSEIASNVKKLLQQAWGSLNADKRANSLTLIANRALKNAGVPGLRYSIESMTQKAKFLSTWVISFNKDIVNRTNLSGSDAAQLAGSVAHESRHAEQAFLAARFLAERNFRIGQIVDKLHIPEYIVNKAAKEKNSNAKFSVRLFAATMATAFLNEDHEETQENLTQAIQRLGELRNTAIKIRKRFDISRAKLFLPKLKRQIVEVKKLYGLYRSIPYEYDAHEVGVSAERAFERLR